MEPAYTLLAIFVPGCIIGTVLGLAGIVTSSRQEIRKSELAADLVTQMLNRKLSVDEIERVLLAWSQDPELAKKMTKAKKALIETKPAPNFA